MIRGVTVDVLLNPEGYGAKSAASWLTGHGVHVRYALDALWAKEASHLGTIVRYADDAVILCRCGADAQHAYRWLQGRAQALKLALHPDKTPIVDLNAGTGGFDFLGFHLRLVKSRRYGRWYCQRWPSGRAMASIRAKVKTITALRSRLKQPIRVLVAELNPVLRGWGNYFRWGNSSRKFSQIDTYVHERLALFDSKKRQRSGRRWGEVHNSSWATNLGVHRLTGTIRHGQPAIAST